MDRQGNVSELNLNGGCPMFCFRINKLAEDIQPGRPGTSGVATDSVAQTIRRFRMRASSTFTAVDLFRSRPASGTSTSSASGARTPSSAPLSPILARRHQRCPPEGFRRYHHERQPQHLRYHRPQARKRDRQRKALLRLVAPLVA